MAEGKIDIPPPIGLLETEDSPVTQAFFLFARVVRRSRALRLSLA